MILVENESVLTAACSTDITVRVDYPLLVWKGYMTISLWEEQGELGMAIDVSYAIQKRVTVSQFHLSLVQAEHKAPAVVHSSRLLLLS